MSVRVRARATEQRRDPQRDVVGDHVLDALRFGVHPFERNVQRAVQEGLEHTMTPHHRDGELFTARAQAQRIRGRARSSKPSASSRRFALLTETLLTSDIAPTLPSAPDSPAELVDRLNVILARTRRRAIGTDRKRLSVALLAMVTLTMVNTY